MATKSGVETPTAAELQRFEQTPKGKQTSGTERASAPDPKAKIARMTDGRTRFTCKPEHAVDLDTGAVVTADGHPADEGDTTTLRGTLEAAAEGLEAAGTRPTADTTAALVADKGYYSRAVLRDLDGSPWRSRIAEPTLKDALGLQVDDEARRMVCDNRAHLRSGVAKKTRKLRAERVEPSS